ncbi:MAG: hypothetical protein JNM40_01870 [Myxococcales bacterium]|nr:hypothetical protein [Myxococcales bacterium]
MNHEAIQLLLSEAIGLQGRGEYKKGIAVIDKALAADPTFAKGYYEKACLLCALGKLDAAIECVKLAARHDPTEVPRMKRDNDLKALRGHPALGGLLGRGAGEPAPALPKALPETVDQAFELLAKVGIKLPKPSVRSGPGESLPEQLAAFYAKAARLPTTSNDSIVSLGSRKSAAKRFAEQLEEATEEGELEGLQPSDFSDTSKLVVLGSSDNGGMYFLDPERWGEIVFELAHDETELRPETTTLGAFVAREAIGVWALNENLDDAFYALQEKGRRAASTRLRELTKAKRPADQKPTAEKPAAKKPAAKKQA